MNTLGFVSIDGERYYLQIKDIKASDRFLLISPYTAQDRIGKGWSHHLQHRRKYLPLYRM